MGQAASAPLAPTLQLPAPAGAPRTLSTTTEPHLDSREIDDLLVSLVRPGVLVELAVLVACIALAWGFVRLLRGKQPVHGSIWFGRRIFDGVLFPLAALLLTFGARLVLTGTVHLALFKLAVPILTSLAVIRLTVRVLRASHPNSNVMRMIERSVSWAAWLAVVLWVTGVLPFLLDAADRLHWKVGATQLSLRNLIEGTVTGGLVLVVALWVSSAIEKRLLAGNGHDLSIRKIAANLVRVLLLFVGLLVALSAVGIDLTALSVLSGALGVGLGFGLQKIAANYVSGFVILAERSLRIGDTVKVDSFEGRIIDIRTRYTVIRADSGREAVVPNEMLITQRVENLSRADPRMSLGCAVQVAYGTDVRALQPRVLAAVAAIDRVITDPAPACEVTAFAADGISLNISFWIADPANGQGNVRSAVSLAVLDVLNAHGVEIPLPQRVLHAPPASGAAPATLSPAAPATAAGRPDGALPPEGAAQHAG